MTEEELKRRYQPVNISIRSSKAKRQQSAEIEAQTAKFLASGGKIETAEVTRSKAIYLTFRHYAMSALTEAKGATVIKSTRTVCFKGYTVEVEPDGDHWCGKILYIKDLITVSADCMGKIEQEAKAAIDDYIDTCLELGVEPNEPNEPREVAR
jgi:hypothetical protein